MEAAPKVGEVWRIRDSRKGEFSIRILTDPTQTFFDGVVVEGRAKFISVEANLFGAGGIGSVVSLRRSFVTWLEQVAQPSGLANIIDDAMFEVEAADAARRLAQS